MVLPVTLAPLRMKANCMLSCASVCLMVCPTLSLSLPGLTLCLLGSWVNVVVEMLLMPVYLDGRFLHFNNQHYGYCWFADNLYVRSF